MKLTDKERDWMVELRHTNSTFKEFPVKIQKRMILKLRELKRHITKSLKK